MLGIFMGLGDTLVNKTGTKSQKKTNCGAYIPAVI